VTGAVFWVLSLVLAGYFFGNIPFIRQYLNVIVLVGIGAAVVPIALAALWKMGHKRAAAPMVRKPDSR
jgi:membrane-associated protein